MALTHLALLVFRGVALQQLFGVTMLRLPGPSLYRGGGPVIFLVRPPATAARITVPCAHVSGRLARREMLNGYNDALQSNHRSWADFYLDVVATDGNAQMLSRMAVALVFPMFMGAVCIIRSVILFQRGRKHDKEVCQ